MSKVHIANRLTDEIDPKAGNSLLMRIILSYKFFEFFKNIYVLIYLAASGLSCSMGDLHHTMQDNSLWCMHLIAPKHVEF